jgi:Bacteriophage minor capsid protein
MLLDELGTFLQTAGIGTVGVTLFKGTMPLDTPSTVETPMVALREVPGLPALRSHDNPPSRIRQPVIQVESRGAPYGYAAARATAEAIWEALDGVANQTLSGTTYLMIQALQDPFLLKIDDMHRPTITFTVRCQRAG